MTHETPLATLDSVGVVKINSPDYLGHMFDLLGAGRVAVPLDAEDDTARRTRTDVRDVVIPSPGTGWLDTRLSVTDDATPALVQFTSGTEAAPKAVLLSRGNLADVVARLDAAMALTPEIREYIGVPVHHSFGYARARAALTAGGAIFIPERFDLGQIRDMLTAGEINALSAVPSQWRVFLNNLSLFGDHLGAVRWVEIGSQPMSSAEKARLRAALPNARIVQHYGMTEASRTTLLTVDDAPEARLDSVGRATGRVEVRIRADGRIETKGPHVALGIDDGTAWQPMGDAAWLTTSDTGQLDDGWLTYLGRADDVINCGGIKLSPDAIEAAVRARLPEARDFTVLRRTDPLRGEGILLALGPEAGPEAPLKEAVEDSARAMGVEAAGMVEVTAVPDLPRTDTGKVQRARLARELSETTTAASETPAGGIAAEMTEILGPRAFAEHRSFHDFGGDSLHHMQMTLLLERLFGQAPEHWEDQPLSDLAKAADTALLTGPPEPAAGLPPLPDGRQNRNPEDIGFWALVREDFLTNDRSLTHQGFLMLFVHRFGNWRMDVRPRLLRLPLSLLYKVLNKLTQLLFGMKLDYTVKVGRRVKLEHFGGMILGAREIGDDTILRQNTTFGIRSTTEPRAKPVIGRFVDIGAGAVIVGNVTIGDNAIIGANTVVFTNVPPNSVVIGVPGRIIGKNPKQNPSPLDLRTD